MTEKKRKLPIAITITDLLISAVFPWIAAKILDFLWKNFRKKLREIRPFKVSGFFAFLKIIFVRTYFKILFDLPSKSLESPRLTPLVELVLKTHKSLHDSGDIEPKICNYCLQIWLKEGVLRRIVQNSELYPSINSPVTFDMFLSHVKTHQ